MFHSFIYGTLAYSKVCVRVPVCVCVLGTMKKLWCCCCLLIIIIVHDKQLLKFFSWKKNDHQHFLAFGKILIDLYAYMVLFKLKTQKQEARCVWGWTVFYNQIQPMPIAMKDNWMNFFSVIFFSWKKITWFAYNKLMTFKKGFCMCSKLCIHTCVDIKCLRKKNTHAHHMEFV